MQEAYRGSVVYDENEEYDSETDSEGGFDENGRRKRRSFKKSNRNSANLNDQGRKSNAGGVKVKLADLAKGP